MVDTVGCMRGLWWLVLVRSKSSMCSCCAIGVRSCCITGACSCCVAGAHSCCVAGAHSCCILLYRRWGLGGTGYLGGDNCVGDSMGSCILVDILSDGGWGCWRVVVVGCVIG